MVGNPQNYQSISLLPVTGKVFERLIYAGLNCFLIQHITLSERQFGFRNKRCTVDAIAKLTEHVRFGLDSLDEMCSDFLDLTKALSSRSSFIKMRKVRIESLCLSSLEIVSI